MSLTVKGYLENADGSTPEIRRFLVDQVRSPNYEYMFAKISEAFPSLRNTAFVMQWKDSDGDLITFSSSGELMEALTSLQGNVFKVFLKPAVAAAADGSEVRHPGVQCDGCERPVVGVRYKCSVCPDYDLCSDCDARSLHAEHDMYRIRRPLPQGRFTGFMPHQGRCAADSSADGWDPRGDLHDLVRQFMRAPTEAAQHQAHARQGEEPRSSSSDKGEPGKAHIGTGSPTESYLRVVGERVAAMLDPLGIDVAVDIEHRDKRVRCGSPRRKSHGRKPCPKEHKKGAECCSRPNANVAEPEPKEEEMVTSPAAPKSRESPEPIADDWTLLEAQAQNMPSPPPEATVPAPAAATDSEPSEPSEPISPGEKTPEMVADDAAAPPAPAPASAPAASRESLYPNLAPSHPDPLVAESLQLMIQMGFKNENDSLTRLLEAMSGNINVAIDELQRRK